MSADDLRRGVGCFNRGQYFEAHEAWERIWKVLPRPSPERARLQGLIQAAGAFHLLQHKGGQRLSGARRLCVGALEKLSRGSPAKSTPMKVRIPGLAAHLRWLVKRLGGEGPGERELALILSKTRKLQASIRS